MITPDDFRSLATSLPEVAEKDHVGLPSFTVAHHGFASLTDGGSRALLRLDEAQVHKITREQPETFTELTEGEKVIGVEIDLGLVPEQQFAQLVRDSWRHRAPSEIEHELDEPS